MAGNCCFHGGVIYPSVAAGGAGVADDLGCFLSSTFRIFGGRKVLAQDPEDVLVCDELECDELECVVNGQERASKWAGGCPPLLPG